MIVDLSLTAFPESKAVYGTTSLQFKLLEQRNEFVTMEINDNQGIYSGFKGIGIFKKNNKTYDLYIVSNFPDNRMFIMTPKCYNKKSQVVSFEGVIVETSDYVPKPGIPVNSTVGAIKVTWLHY
jgi:hypothetical protein